MMLPTRRGPRALLAALHVQYCTLYILQTLPFMLLPLLLTVVVGGGGTRLPGWADILCSFVP